MMIQEKFARGHTEEDERERKHFVLDGVDQAAEEIMAEIIRENLKLADWDLDHQRIGVVGVDQAAEKKISAIKEKCRVAVEKEIPPIKASKKHIDIDLKVWLLGWDGLFCAGTIIMDILQKELTKTRKRAK